MELKSKNVIYVGGCNGIGFEVCKLLLQKGIATLIILDCMENVESLATLRAINPNIPVHFKQLDITDLSEIEQTFAEIMQIVPRIDMLVNGAGIIDETNVERSVKVNLIGLINTTTAAYKRMDKRFGGAGGVVVNIGSLAAIYPCVVMPVYTAAKAGVVSFTKSLAGLQDITDVTMYAICPGGMPTGLTKKLSTYLDLDIKLSERKRKFPMQNVEDCARNMLTAMEQHKNGAIWILENGNLQLYEENE